MTVLTTPPDMRVRIRRFNEDEQALPISSLNSRLLVLLAKRSSFLRHLQSSWPCAKGLCGSCHVGSLVFAEHPSLSSAESACARDASVSSNSNECAVVSTAPNLRTVSIAMRYQSSPSSLGQNVSTPHASLHRNSAATPGNLAFANLFLVFSRRDDLLPEATQISPDKDINFLCTSSPFTWSIDWERLSDVWRTCLTDPAL